MERTTHWIEEGASGMFCRSKDREDGYALSLATDDGGAVILEMDEESAKEVKDRLDHWL